MQDLDQQLALPADNEAGGMRASGSCIGCHPGQYASWHQSFHRTMTQPADPGTVVAPFDGRTLRAHGRAFVVDRMQSAMELRVPLVVESAWSDTWIDAK